MVKEIVFHLGDCKTGTTSIQSALAEARFSAAGRTWIYPTRMNHIPVADVLRGDPDPALRHERWSRLAERITAASEDTAIISAETFEFVRPEALAEAISTYLPGFDGRMRLITYIRPHAERFVSTYAEKSKQGEFFGPLDDGFRDFLSRRRLTYKPRLSRWKSVFGDAYEVRPMIRDLLPGGDVVTDFLNFAFPGADLSLEKGASDNESLSVADILALQRLHRALSDSPSYPDDVMRALGWNLATFLGTLPKPDTARKPRLYRALAETIRNDCIEDAQALDATFFAGTPYAGGHMARALDRAVDSAPGSPVSMAIEDYYSPDALRMLDGITLLLRRVIEADPKHFRQCVRPESLRPEWMRTPEIQSLDDAAPRASGMRSLLAGAIGRFRR